jgi:hypothetical protein
MSEVDKFDERLKLAFFGEQEEALDTNLFRTFYISWLNVVMEMNVGVFITHQWCPSCKTRIHLPSSPFLG